MRVTLVALALLAFACRTPDPAAPRHSPGEHQVMMTAAQDFTCAQDQIAVTAAGPELYEASGCGRQGMYAVKCARADASGGTSCTARAVEPDEPSTND